MKTLTHSVRECYRFDPFPGLRVQWVGRYPSLPGLGSGFIDRTVIELHVPGSRSLERLEIQRGGHQLSTSNRQRVMARIK